MKLKCDVNCSLTNWYCDSGGRLGRDQWNDSIWLRESWRCFESWRGLWCNEIDCVVVFSSIGWQLAFHGSIFSEFFANNIVLSHWPSVDPIFNSNTRCEESVDDNADVESTPPLGGPTIRQFLMLYCLVWMLLRMWFCCDLFSSFNDLNRNEKKENENKLFANKSLWYYG